MTNIAHIFGSGARIVTRIDPESRMKPWCPEREELDIADPEIGLWSGFPARP